MVLETLKVCLMALGKMNVDLERAIAVSSSLPLLRGETLLATLSNQLIVNISQANFAII